MKIIIAGGRHFKYTKDHIKFLIEIHNEWNITEIVSGKAKGADTFGELFASYFGIPVKGFKPSWNDIKDKPDYEIGTNKYGFKYWKLAGHSRNSEMANYADGVILFPGASGTKDMKNKAIKNDLRLWEYSDELIII